VVQHGGYQMSTNYQLAIDRLNKTNNVEDLLKLEKSFANLYSAGVLNMNNFLRLDEKLCEKISDIKEWT